MRRKSLEPQRAEPYAYFMIRVQRSSRTGSECSLSGLVERLATGEKERFSSTHELISGGECKQTGPEWWDVECTYFSGWGTVPANHVTGTFGGGLAVHTDLRDNPDCMLWGADPGIVSVRWRRTGLYESRHSGSQEWRHGPFLIRQGGSWRSSSAAAKGEVLGLSLPDTGSGDMSTGRGVTMQFQRTTGD